MSQPKQKQRESVKAVTYGLEEDAAALAETISAGCGVAGWDVGDEDLELPEELVAKISASTAGDKGFYAVPPRGLPPPHM
ncbi:hypothetical protein pipiens_018658 [Culex pipiens pipiens]|uniref:Uncharacterized protein n=1 Tax=Culex pipiens pipiens TaxID=38569 RepID=A0ABD1CAR9_CULPP